MAFPPPRVGVHLLVVSAAITTRVVIRSQTLFLTLAVGLNCPFLHVSADWPSVENIRGVNANQVAGSTTLLSCNLFHIQSIHQFTVNPGKYLLANPGKTLLIPCHDVLIFLNSRNLGCFRNGAAETLKWNNISDMTQLIL